jgi:2-hydroxychromene-2-carboxylate isomerase
MPERVRFHFDPRCPWAWQGALWIREVEAVRDIQVEWCLFSLFHVQEHHDEFGDDVRDEMTLGLRALSLVRREGGNEAIGRAYEVLGERVHGMGRKLTAEECRSALADGGFAPGVVDRAMADPSTLDEVVAEHEAVVQEVGAFGVPTIVLPDGKGIFGPVTAVAPTGEEAGELWDHVRWLAERDDFFELKRNRDRKPGAMSKVA